MYVCLQGTPNGVKQRCPVKRSGYISKVSLIV